MANTQVVEPIHEYKKWHIGYTASAHINVIQAFQIEAGHAIKESLELTLNSGYIYGINSGNLHKGVRLRPALRYIFGGGENSSLYLDLGYLYRFDQSKQIRDFNVGVNLTETSEVTLKRKLTSPILIFGGRGKINNSFYMDGGVGFGFSSNFNVYLEGKPEGALELIDENEFTLFRNFFREQNGSFPVAIWHLKIIYKFNFTS